MGQRVEAIRKLPQSAAKGVAALVDRGDYRPALRTVVSTATGAAIGPAAKMIATRIPLKSSSVAGEVEAASDS